MGSKEDWSGYSIRNGKAVGPNGTFSVGDVFGPAMTTSAYHRARGLKERFTIDQIDVHDGEVILVGTSEDIDQSGNVVHKQNNVVVRPSETGRYGPKLPTPSQPKRRPEVEALLKAEREKNTRRK